VIPANPAEKLCPACLLSGALDLPRSVAETVVAASGELQPGYEPSQFPCKFGGYQLLGLLGRGGMGTVYEAEHTATGRRVALKMLGHQIDSPDMRQRFLREGRLAAGVNHPNSLYIFGSEEIEGVPVITMEITGVGTLQDKLNKRGPLPVPEAVDAILDVISGLDSAFRSGVLHRDVKPSNCFVWPDGSVKVGDFGLSVSTLTREDSLVTTLGRVLGTPAYASPEQLRGDPLDVRADIYSVGATLFSLLTDRVPFEGENAVQVVLNAVSQKPKRLAELRDDVPPDLERVVNRCLSKDPDGRYAGYTELRNALLPFSSREPEPASMKIRMQAGWIDYLIAFLIPYVILMLAIGNEAFHFSFLMERTLYSARYNIAFLCLGILYFTIAEGIWGGGFGKRFKGLRVVRPNGRSPGIGRGLIRILLPILCVEGVRIPFLMATITATSVNRLTVLEIVLYSTAVSICPMIPILLAITASRKKDFTTFWDLASRTRVVMKPEVTQRTPLEPAAHPADPVEAAESLGPYQIAGDLVPAKWIVGTDLLLNRRVWLMRRSSLGPSLARRNLSRHGRLRWLQKLETSEATWDAFEAIQGVPFSSLVEDEKHVPWSTLRHWLHDLATELWEASGDQTVPDELSLDHVWITSQGRAVLLDEPWPEVKKPAERMPVGDIADQQRFLNAIAAYVESTSLPLHARPVLQNLGNGKFEKLSFLVGVLRGLLDKPAQVSKGIRAGSIFMLPLYIWIMLLVGAYTADRPQGWYDSGGWVLMAPTLLLLVGSALIQLLSLPLRTTAGQSLFRLAVVDAKGKRAGIFTLFVRWGIAWLPLLVPVSFVALLIKTGDLNTALVVALVSVVLWFGVAIYGVVHPNRGLHDRLAGTWVVRR
jgi:uncharacterized RDD family membrane protein YckC